MPRLWNETIEAHRHAVREATLDAAAALVAEHGLLAVTMSGIAQRAGIGRATLYKYFPDVESIVLAWHERQISAHLAQLVEARDRAAPEDRLAAVLHSYARLSRHSHAHTGFTTVLRRGHDQARPRLARIIQDLVSDGAQAGHIRADVAPAELAAYCLHALAGAADCTSEAAVRRLVAVTLSGLRA